MPDRQQPDTPAITRPEAARGFRALIWALRAVRNLLAVCGVAFIYLLVLGYQQYSDRLAAGDKPCAFSRCM